MLVVVPATLAAQTGSGGVQCELGEHVACVGIESNLRENGIEREWPRAIVIFRAPRALGRFDFSNRSPRDTVAEQSSWRAYREARLLAERKERLFHGGLSNGLWWGFELSGWSVMLPRASRGISHDRMFGIGRTCLVPRLDTAVVVLVEGVFGTGERPQVIAAVTVPSPSRRKPEDKRWTSGDTTFLVRAKAEGITTEEFLRSIPEVRAFLARPRTP